MRRPVAAPVRLVAFAAVLAVLFGAGLATGDVFGPQRDVADHQVVPDHRGSSAPAGHGSDHPTARDSRETKR